MHHFSFKSLLQCNNNSDIVRCLSGLYRSVYDAIIILKRFIRSYNEPDETTFYPYFSLLKQCASSLYDNNLNNEVNGEENLVFGSTESSTIINNEHAIGTHFFSSS